MGVAVSDDSWVLEASLREADADVDAVDECIDVGVGDLRDSDALVDFDMAAKEMLSECVQLRESSVSEGMSVNVCVREAVPIVRVRVSELDAGCELVSEVEWSGVCDANDGVKVVVSDFEPTGTDADEVTEAALDDVLVNDAARFLEADCSSVDESELL